jgi:hypothetical protein
MNDKELTNALIASRHFTAMPGMSVRAEGKRAVFVGWHGNLQYYSPIAGDSMPEDWDPEPGEICFSDPATVGCLLAMAQNAYRNDGLHVHWHGTAGYSVVGLPVDVARTVGRERFRRPGIALAHAIICAP